ncbi:hypothetical protein CJP74_04315 [Psittacicella melopsittaci]|uniref:Uncharacterized protein n=1 Tax=Psittacicella melopsittaci TaxID=2028576 RepID=A0A3A1Y8V0_9GAMM|nr:NAD(P)H-binding protein [Psittacicella melopsittaci]RIY32547.1 hypothetical protein CJP74_04315 [Psittacicella melopsittaci]
MKILVLSSNGKAGTLVAQELLARGHQVTGNSHSANRNAFLTSYLEKDIRNLTKEDVAGYDAVVNAFGVLGEEAQITELYAQVNKHLLDLLAGSKTTLYVVGGAGSLFVDAKTNLALKDTPDFPAEYQAVANAQAYSLKHLFRGNQTVNWVFISPAAFFDFEGELTKNVVLAGPDFTVNNEGQSYLSYKDFAWELANQVEAQKLNRAWVNFRQGDK